VESAVRVVSILSRIHSLAGRSCVMGHLDPDSAIAEMRASRRRIEMEESEERVERRADRREELMRRDDRSDR
jgi:hypothetical protein